MLLSFPPSKCFHFNVMPEEIWKRIFDFLTTLDVLFFWLSNDRHGKHMMQHHSFTKIHWSYHHYHPFKWPGVIRNLNHLLEFSFTSQDIDFKEHITRVIDGILEMPPTLLKLELQCYFAELLLFDPNFFKTKPHFFSKMRLDGNRHLESQKYKDEKHRLWDIGKKFPQLETLIVNDFVPFPSIFDHDLSSLPPSLTHLELPTSRALTHSMFRILPQRLKKLVISSLTFKDLASHCDYLGDCLPNLEYFESDPSYPIKEASLIEKMGNMRMIKKAAFEIDSRNSDFSVNINANLPAPNGNHAMNQGYGNHGQSVVPLPSNVGSKSSDHSKQQPKPISSTPSIIFSRHLEDIDIILYGDTRSRLPLVEFSFPRLQFGYGLKILQINSWSSFFPLDWTSWLPSTLTVCHMNLPCMIEEGLLAKLPPNLSVLSFGMICDESTDFKWLDSCSWASHGFPSSLTEINYEYCAANRYSRNWDWTNPNLEIIDKIQKLKTSSSPLLSSSEESNTTDTNSSSLSHSFPSSSSSSNLPSNSSKSHSNSSSLSQSLDECSSPIYNNNYSSYSTLPYQSYSNIQPLGIQLRKLKLQYKILDDELLSFWALPSANPSLSLSPSSLNYHQSFSTIMSLECWSQPDWKLLHSLTDSRFPLLREIKLSCHPAYCKDCFESSAFYGCRKKGRRQNSNKNPLDSIVDLALGEDDENIDEISSNNSDHTNSNGIATTHHPPPLENHNCFASEFCASFAPLSSSSLPISTLPKHLQSLHLAFQTLQWRWKCICCNQLVPSLKRPWSLFNMADLPQNLFSLTISNVIITNVPSSMGCVLPDSLTQLDLSLDEFDTCTPPSPLLFRSSSLYSNDINKYNISNSTTSKNSDFQDYNSEFSFLPRSLTELTLSLSCTVIPSPVFHGLPPKLEKLNLTGNGFAVSRKDLKGLPNSLTSLSLNTPINDAPILAEDLPSSIEYVYIHGMHFEGKKLVRTPTNNPCQIL